MSRFSDAARAAAIGFGHGLDWLGTSADPRDVAICTVHGNTAAYDGDFARRFAWPKLQIEQLRRHTAPGYTVYAFGNQLMPEHAEFLKSCPEVRFFSSDDISNSTFKHVWPLRNWLTRVATKSHRIIVHLDSDAFPVRDGWLDQVVNALTYRTPMIAAQRLENGDTHSDRCFLVFHRAAFRQHAFDFSSVGEVDAGGNISTSLDRSGFGWTKMLRSNRHDYHHVISGLYADMIYHHGGGSRVPRFRSNFDQMEADKEAYRRERVLHRILIRRVFKHTDAFLAELRGEAAPFDLETAIQLELKEQIP